MGKPIKSEPLILFFLFCVCATASKATNNKNGYNFEKMSTLKITYFPKLITFVSLQFRI